MIQTVLTAAAVLFRIISNPLANVFQKHLSLKGNHPLLINFLTYALLSLVCIAFVIPVHWSALPASFWMYSVAGGIAGGLGNGFLVRALQKGDLSVLGPINAYKAVVGMIVGIFLLAEYPNPWGIAGVALIIYGSYFVLDTPEDQFSLALFKRPEIQFRLWAMILTAIEAVFLKKIILASSVSIAFTSWCWFGMLFSFLFPWFFGVKWKKEMKRLSVKDTGSYLLLVLCIGIMQFTTTYALDHMPVGYALSLFQLSAIVSVLLGHRVFKEQGIRKKLLGSAIMIIGSVLIILLKDK